MNKLSYTQYKMWTECPLKWKLSYPDGLRETVPNIHMLFGTAMHETIQDWLTNYVYGGSLVSAQTVDLRDTLKTKMMEQFQLDTIEENGVKQFPCDKNELMEFYQDGVEILSYLQKNVEKYFNDEWKLEAIELPLEIEVKNGVTFIGYLDVVLYHKLTGLYKIIDLKTSSWGWRDYAKKDKTKTNQLLFYKKFFAEQYDVSEDYVDVEFVILKRKINENSHYPQHRITSFSPPNKTPSMNKAVESLDDFLHSCFDKEGEYVVDHIEATPSKFACRYCPFKDRKDLCPVGISE